MTDLAHIRGHLVPLSNGAQVFAGRAESEPDIIFLSFVSSGGEHTRIKLTYDAASALKNIILREDGVETPPAKLQWRVVEGSRK